MIVKETLEKYNSLHISNGNVIDLLIKEENYLIGKYKSEICFIVKTNGAREKSFKNGKMRISLNGKYQINNIIDKYSIIFYSSSESKKLEIFLETMVNLVKDEQLTDVSLYDLYNDISDVFKTFIFDFSLFVGVFGELEIIKHVYENTGLNLVESYQSNSLHLVDFKLNNYILEVKTTLSGERKHKINNNQLEGKGYLCSVLIHESNLGITFEDLLNEVNDLFKTFPKKYAYLRNYLISIPPDVQSEKYKCDLEDVKFFNFDDVPKISNYHESITNIKFTCDLSNIKATDITDIIKK